MHSYHLPFRSPANRPLCTRNISRALIERPYSREPQAVGAVYDRPGFFVQSPSMANGGGYEAVCDFSGVDDHSLSDDRRSRAATVGGAGEVVGEGPASRTPRRGGGGLAEWKELRTGRLGARAGRSTTRRGVRSRNGPLA